jgi:transposase-like protein
MTRVKLDHWREHLAAALKEKKSLSDYAREHGLSRYTLYAARRQLKDEAPALAKRARVRRTLTASAFVAVQVEASAVGLRIRLPNKVEVDFVQLEPSAWAALMKVLAALPCFG